MKRITSACLEQTIRFFDVSGLVKPETEFEQYKSKLDKRKTKYQVLDTKKAEDGALVIKIRKQYNTYDMDGYL